MRDEKRYEYRIVKKGCECYRSNSLADVSARYDAVRNNPKYAIQWRDGCYSCNLFFWNCWKTL